MVDWETAVSDRTSSDATKFMFPFGRFHVHNRDTGEQSSVMRAVSTDDLHTTRAAEFAVRRSWLDHVVGASQHIAGRSLIADREELQELLREFIESLPRSTTGVESLLLRSLLLDVAYHCSHAFLERVNQRGTSECPLVPGALLGSFWSVPSEPIRAFRLWMDAFFDELDRCHPLTVASRASRVLKRQFKTQWSVEALARQQKVTPGQLQRSFKREFGLAVHEYQCLARLVAALDQIRHDKIDAVALEVGYRSKKNFYRAFQSLTGVTPAAFRRLPADTARQIQESALLRLHARRFSSRRVT